ncbi:MAG: hypothetical protein AUI14_00710 [Actinobacteria bacterium 13_2_20CM_2_71_6]|nr:MAG: hypothetical protein AUI14_00710 [Actinobacteria bacterium 13_2_20CM_2_71_6]
MHPLAGDTARLDDLRDPGNTIFATLSAGNYDKHFTLYRCTGAAGSSRCVFYNKVGDVLELRLSNALLGKAHAVTDGQFQAITFPIDDLRAYAQEALDAWVNHNDARLELLATPEAVNKLKAIPDAHRGDTWTFKEGQGAAGSSYLTWTNPAGDALIFRFLNAAVAAEADRQHRIVDVIFQPHG